MPNEDTKPKVIFLFSSAETLFCRKEKSCYVSAPRPFRIFSNSHVIFAGLQPSGFALEATNMPASDHPGFVSDGRKQSFWLFYTRTLPSRLSSPTISLSHLSRPHVLTLNLPRSHSLYHAVSLLLLTRNFVFFKITSFFPNFLEV